MFKDLKENNSKGKMETIKKESNENSRAEKYNTWIKKFSVGNRLGVLVKKIWVFSLVA